MQEYCNCFYMYLDCWVETRLLCKVHLCAKLNVVEKVKTQECIVTVLQHANIFELFINLGDHKQGWIFRCL